MLCITVSCVPCPVSCVLRPASCVLRPVSSVQCPGSRVQGPVQSRVSSKQNYQFGITGESDICSGCNLEHMLNNIIEMLPENYKQNKCPIKKLQAN